ncbi:MAG: AAA family ATPase, partial [Candidatus Omnitrophica bacterium]|nr:AAA family ATPase [Candidatus Omnitrophota bacterium]
MHFKSLELYGFKSFAEKTKLEFEPGITAIVGPNGCGKSNVSDAIKWVLGEQSPRELRGLKMEDIIFNGTSLKEAVNFSEVSLTLSNEEKILPIEYEEITISRRLFRSGESEYLLNKTPVRLRDIQELFMGTGIGISAYSLLEQGKMDLILSSRAEDRRFIFEEAAGITKFKSQKRETLRRLDDTENNLLRVNDILVEVKRQISSIERQANKAERYKEIANVARDKEIKINRHSYLDLKNQLKELEIERNLLKSQEDKLVLEQGELESRIREGRDYLDNIEQEITNLHSSEISLNSSLEKNQNRISLNKERIKELEERKSSLEGEIKSLADKISTDSNELNNIRIQAEDFIKSEESRKSILGDKRNFINSIELQLKEKESLVSGSKVRLMSAV